MTAKPKRRKGSRGSSRLQQQQINISKNFAELLEQMDYDRWPEHVPNHANAPAAPSQRPSRFFCAACDNVAAYMRDVAADPKRAAFRDEILRLLNRGDEPKDFGLAPYRLGATVPGVFVS